MAALATYMGHVNIYATYCTQATADLMRDVAAAGEGFLIEGPLYGSRSQSALVDLLNF